MSWKLFAIQVVGHVDVCHVRVEVVVRAVAQADCHVNSQVVVHAVVRGTYVDFAKQSFHKLVS